MLGLALNNGLRQGFPGTQLSVLTCLIAKAVILREKLFPKKIMRDSLAAKGGILKRAVGLEEMILIAYVPWDLTESKAHKRTRLLPLLREKQGGLPLWSYNTEI